MYMFFVYKTVKTIDNTSFYGKSKPEHYIKKVIVNQIFKK